MTESMTFSCEIKLDDNEISKKSVYMTGLDTECFSSLNNEDIGNLSYNEETNIWSLEEQLTTVEESNESKLKRFTIKNNSILIRIMEEAVEKNINSFLEKNPERKDFSVKVFLNEKHICSGIVLLENVRLFSGIIDT
jgi:hypothetical protein